MTFSAMSMISSVLAMIAVLSNQQVNVHAASAIDLGDCSGFSMMAGTAVAFNGVASSVAIGSVGVSPGTSITGAYVMGNGAVEANSAAAITCASSMAIAYAAAVGTNCTNSTTPTDLTDLTLTAGVYCNTAGYFTILAGALTLHGSASDVWIFQAATSVTTAASTAVTMSGGALASNVFWQVGTTLVMGADSLFQGTVLSGTSITMGSGSKINGRLMAQAAVSTASGNTVVGFVAGTAPASSPTSITAGVSSTGSASANNLSDGSIAAIVVMSFIGLLAAMALIYYSLTRKPVEMESMKVAGKANNV